MARELKAFASMFVAMVHALIMSCILISQLAPASAQTNAAITERLAARIDQIVRCASSGEEAVLFSREPVKCVPYLAGRDSVDKDMPLGVNLGEVCTDPQDQRRLSADVVKSISERHPLSVDPSGIRIFGAVFCEALDLMGLDLPYSLVIDNSIFVKGIQARSFHTRGDLSLDGTLVAGELFLARSHVDGTVFANNSLIAELRILDSQVFGSVLLRNTVFLEPAILDTVSLGGELGMRGAAFPYLLVQFTKIGGVFDLTNSQARCAYDIRQSEIGEIITVDAGFGTARDERSFDWRDAERFKERIQAARNVPLTSKAANDKSCNHRGIASSPATFLISDTRIRSSLCLRSFHWLDSDRPQDSYITFADVNVGTVSSIDLLSGGTNFDRFRNQHLTILGLETKSLMFNFSGSDDPGRAYSLSLSGLKFDHVYSVGGTRCDYDPDFATPRLQTVSNPGSALRLPHVKEVMAWLQSNALGTTQPFATFVEVFQKDGEDDAAKDLRIARASAELRAKARRVFSGWTQDRLGTAAADQERAEGNGFGDHVNAFAAVSFGGLLWLIADHGFHPEKVGWWVVGVIAVFALYFWFKLKIVGIKVKDSGTILPVGILFLFDRLLPAYQIREDHYHIEAFYKRVPRQRPIDGVQLIRVDLTTLRYLSLAHAVTETTEAEKEHAEKCLSILKVIGLVLAVFMVAAINAIVSH